MRLPRLAVAGVLAAALGGSALPAWAELSGPANPPPASFQGMQYIDAQGCLFLRAGFGAKTVWVPMIDQNRKPICGMAPTFGGAAQVAAAAPVAPPAPAPAPVQAPAPAPAAKPVAVAAPPAAMPAAAAPVVAPVVAPAPPPVVAVAVAAPAPAKLPPAPAQRGYQVMQVGQTVASCADTAPVLERVMLRNGGSALVCTQGDGTLSGWQPPRFPAGAGVGAALGYVAPTADNLRGARLAGAVAPAAQATAAAAIPTPPKGWKLAWDDDRLNPMRGIGTAAGQAAQDRVWTKTVPAVAVAAPVAPLTAAPTARVSTMSAPAAAQAAPVAQGQVPRYVQIGSFAVAANAAGASARIEGLGLPAAKSQITRGGTLLQVVYAGPFASAEAAALALQQLKAAGFRDAIIR